MSTITVDPDTKGRQPKEKVYRGMHNGTVAGKWFEKTRRNRKRATKS